MIPVFVYGILRGSQDCKHGKVRGYAMHDAGSFPAAIPGTDKDCIVGELIQVNTQQLNVFDQIEGHPHFYVRTDVEVELDEGETEKAQMYVLATLHRASIIASGRHKHGVTTNKHQNGDTTHSYR